MPPRLRRASPSIEPGARALIWPNSGTDPPRDRSARRSRAAPKYEPSPPHPIPPSAHGLGVFVATPHASQVIRLDIRRTRAYSGVVSTLSSPFEIGIRSRYPRRPVSSQKRTRETPDARRGRAAVARSGRTFARRPGPRGRHLAHRGHGRGRGAAARRPPTAAPTPAVAGLRGLCAAFAAS